MISPGDMPLAAALEYDVPDKMRSVVADLRDELLEYAGSRATTADIAAQLELVGAWTERQLSVIGLLHEHAAAFNGRLPGATDEIERRTAILEFAEAMGAKGRQLRSDAKALDRFLDSDAILERYRLRVGERERALIYGFDRFGELLARAAAEGAITGESGQLTGPIADLLAKGREWRGEARVRHASYRCLRRLVQGMPVKPKGFWVDLAVRDMRRVALNGEEDAWAQCDALATLHALSPQSLKAVLDRILKEGSAPASPLAADNRLFVRRFLANFLVDEAARSPRFMEQLRLLAYDDAGSVRQALALAIPRLPPELFEKLYARLRVDRDPQVKAALFADPQAMAEASGGAPYLAHIVRVLGRESDEFVLRMAIFAAERFAEWQLGHSEAGLDEVAGRLRQGLAKLRQRDVEARIARWAGVASERIWLVSNQQARELASDLRESVAPMREGQVKAMKRLRAPLAENPRLVGRVLAVLAEEDFGFECTLSRRPRLRRGDRFKRRLWRILFEWRNTATDKRQAWFHTIGRAYRGPIIAPPAHMGELAPTKVPGEPLHFGGEAGWRNYVPLLDHVLSVIDRGGRMELFTSEGITTLEAPRGLWRRLRAYLAISWKFADLAALRNQTGNDYVKALRARGLGIEHAAYPDGSGDSAAVHPRVTRFFDLGGPLAGAAMLGQSALAYFVTLYENSLLQLGVFIAIAAAWFAGRHIIKGRMMRRRREGVALVLGGWGTRGKSGTERLKAGLINALGHPLVSKTTGCEAMFLLGGPCGDLREMFLFRPYDKATIWEQYDLIRVTRGLKARVFLWECMGLTPSYVRVLQKDWMRDDIATITNTYPDHEDVQGPAGRNIPEVMTQFIPERSVLLTTEEEMLPILRQGAEQCQTRIRPVGWREAGLIHQDLLDRFPYAEHPYNIALVTAMADEMGLEADFAVKEMSDRVVADLGVLKTYPRSTIDGRTLEFVMGMSANERFGAMGNWDRMGFAKHDLGVDPQIFISTVVNNRADRVPRSRVFARILVEDIAADRHVLIGSNIEGLLGFIEEAWADYAPKITLINDDAAPLAMLEKEAKRQRVPLSGDELFGLLEAMTAPQRAKAPLEALKAAFDGGTVGQALEGLEHKADILTHFEEKQDQLGQYEALKAKLAAGGDPASLDGELRAFLRTCFMAKLLPVREYYTPGEEVVRIVARATPPGLINRVMGMQNIKGTGLDWVYRWQAWEACHKACQQALDSNPSVARRGLDYLGTFQEYGCLSQGHVRAALAALRADPGQSGTNTAELDAIAARLDSQMATFEKEDDGGKSASKGGGKVMELAEALLDASDAVRRRKAADRIYRDMIAEQVSGARAAYELKKLTTRQKGGWLATDVGSVTGALAAMLPWRRKRLAG